MSEPVREIDLHGRRVEGALRFLEQELTYCRARRLSPVLVIVGRGWHSPGQRAVLAAAARAWLEGPRGRGLGVAGLKVSNQGGAFLVDVEG